MQFNSHEWLKIYNKVQFLGHIIRDSYEKLDEKGKWVAAIYPISKEASESIENEIEGLLIKNKEYLDACELKPSPPLWKFNIKDQTTWPSSKEFKYKRLMRSCKYTNTHGLNLSIRCMEH